MVFVKKEVWAIKGSLGALPPQFRVGTFLLNISPHGPNEVRMGNLGVRLVLFNDVTGQVYLVCVRVGSDEPSLNS